MFSITIVVAICVLWRVVPSVAYSWQLNAAPTQCTDISITVTGTDGKPPYSVLVVPYGPSPLNNGAEVRAIIQKSFNGNSDSVNVPINYPANSQFVAVVSDTAGFGTGGTSAPTLVGESADDSCFNSSQQWKPSFNVRITPGPVVGKTEVDVEQCSPSTRIWWDLTANVEGTPSFVGIIPGGLSFPIGEESGITNMTDEGTGFSWLPPICEGTQLWIVGGDNRGLGAGGKTPPVNITHSDNSSCVTASSPGVTPGPAAGGVKSTRNMTAIIGGAVGGSVGFVALCAVALLYIRHRRNLGNHLRGSAVNRDGIEPFTNLGSSPINGFGYENTAASMMQVTTSTQPGMATVIQHRDGGPGNLLPSYDSLTNTQQVTTPGRKIRAYRADQTNRPI